ncbi:synaptonemal complex protein 1 [Bombella mellum]|uniref:Uncharacterized protein n=1 Tax=Bombella mellum TaxID=2039288 RepID=A0ABR5ZSD4_9PROT|nr:hypothetical protein [Bombella mellum]MBA5727221.1 hypothetical protein [Bombella mellum]
MQSKKNFATNDIEKKEKEIESLLEKVLRSPIGDYKEAQESLERGFKNVQEITTKFSDRLNALPDNVEDIVKKIKKDIEDGIDGLKEESDNLFEEKIAILSEYLEKFNENVQKNPEHIRKITCELKEDVDALVAEKTVQLSEQMDRLPHVHEAMETKIQALFASLQGDFCRLAEQGQKKHAELLTSFDQHSQSVKDAASQVGCEIDKIPAIATQHFKEVVDDCQVNLKDLINRHIDRVEETNRRTIAIQEKIKIDSENCIKMLQESLAKQENSMMLSLENLQNSFLPIRDDEKLILSMLKESGSNTEKELLTLKNELVDVHRNARSHKMVLMILLIITLFVTCGDGVLELLKLFHH